MNKGLLLLLTVVCLGAGVATAAGPKEDVFKGKLFVPNIILEHQDELKLSKQQFTAIRAAVVEVQGNVAGHEWDVREAYLNLMSELDKAPIDEKRVLEHANKALLAENEVKKQQMVMLIRLRNLLTAEQVEYLENAQGK
jgi:Spy/CpxP family protein refolding chaperone